MIGSLQETICVSYKNYPQRTSTLYGADCNRKHCMLVTQTIIKNFHPINNRLYWEVYRKQCALAWKLYFYGVSYKNYHTELLPYRKQTIKGSL